MNIFRMICFVTLAGASTFHEAAEKLYISQSSLSNNIQTIERQYGVKLVRRMPRGFKLTDAGIKFLEYAEKIVSEYDGMNSKLARYAMEKGNRVRVYAEPGSSYAYNYMLANFQMSEPQIKVEVSEQGRGHIIDRIKSEQDTAGIIFSRDTSAISGIKKRTLAVDSLVALVSEKHRLANRKSICFYELKNETLQIISQEHSAFLYELIAEQCRLSGFSPSISSYSLWYKTMLNVIRELGFAAVISSIAAGIFCLPDMRVIEISDAIPFYVDILISDGPINVAAQKLFDFVY